VNKPMELREPPPEPNILGNAWSIPLVSGPPL
jgi:hypothetical protein